MFKLITQPLVVASISALVLSGCGSSTNKDVQESVKSNKLFAPVKSFLKDERNLRKWDAPTIADLDQDGYPDLLLNDHGFSVKIVWNNKGTFAKPYDLIMGDMHGISVEDFDQDGKLEVIIARGGGSGSNARNSVLFEFDKNRNFTQLDDFEEPLVFMRGRTVKFVDIDSDGDSDLINFAFPSQEKKGESENYLYENQDGKTYTLNSRLPPSKVNGQKVLLTDFNNDGHVDIFMYGYKDIKVYQGSAGFEFSDVTKQVLPKNISDVSSIVEIDYDNDGDFDIFLTKGNEFERGQTFYNEETQTLGFFTSRGPFDFLLKGVGDVLHLENIQSQWPNKNLYIGESGYDYAFPGETHSGRDIRLVNSDALGFAETRDKKGTYVGYIGNRDWRLAGNIFSPFTGIVHGVESYEPSEIDVGYLDVLLVNEGGVFVDKTTEAKLGVSDHTTGSAVGDLNNDGFDDIVVIRRGTLVNDNTAIVYMNEGNGRFNQIENHGVVTTERGAIGMGVDIFDFDLDGQKDILIGHDRGKWHLFRNLGANSSFIKVKVGESPQNGGTPLGARLELTGCNKVQTKTLGSTSAAYSLNYTDSAIFGLGACQQPKELKVIWSNGEVQKRVVNSEKNILVGKIAD